MDSPLAVFNHGIQNLYNDEIIEPDAAQDALGFATRDGKEVLIGGRSLLGIDSGTTGVSRGLWYGNKTDGSLILYRKTETKLQYLDNTDTWQDILINLTPGTEASFANYSSLAGQFTFFVTSDGYWKLNNSFPLNPINMYNSVVNFHGRILIDKGRTLLWDRNDINSRDRTTLYGSHKDTQDAPYYQSVTNEIEQTGDGATKVYNAILKTLPNLCNMFGLTVYAPTGATKTVTAITNARNAQITTSGAHGLSVGDTVVFNGVKSGQPLTGTGTVSSDGNYNLVGVGTAFTTQLKIGARLFITAQATYFASAAAGGAQTFPITMSVIVQNITDDTHLSIQFPLNFGAPGSDQIIQYSSCAFTFSSMSQLTNVPALVNDIIDSMNFLIAVDSTNFDIYSSGDTVNKAEVLVDNRQGGLSAIGGATGTINYMTGAYTFNFINNVVNAGSVVATYFYENSNNGGLTDFTQSGTRIAGEGFIQPQDKGGDPIMNVLIGQDGGYYSLKQQRAYKFTLADDDITAENDIYYENMGIPSINSGVSTQQGILFLNTSNPDKPEMTLLVKNQVNSTLTPTVKFPEFKFSLYDYSDAYFDTYERYIVISCKVMGALQNNRILLCNISDGTVNVSPYEARMFAKDNVANFYVGSPLQENTYQIYNGFDDLGNPVNAFWIGAAQMYANLKLRSAKWRFIREELKKFRKFNIKGQMSLDQSVQVLISYDDAPFQLIGTIYGRGTYVDSGSGEAIGSNFIGNILIGGDQLTNVFTYFCQIKLKNMPKFRKRVIKLIPIGIGYFDFNFMSDFDIMLFENRLPARYRSQQNVSLDGKESGLP